MIVQSDMPFIKLAHINKIYTSLLKKNHLVHVLKYENTVGNPIGFDTSVIKKFKKIKGDIGAKYMIKRLSKNTNFIKTSTNKIFKDFDLKKDFN
jgi:molybdenum cofactor cytidylyltransferase